MLNTKLKIFISIGLCAAICAFFWVAYTASIDDFPANPKVPTKSAPGKIILTSRGCCFTAMDLTVSLLEEDNNKTVIISKDYVYEYDIFEYEDIPVIDAPVQVVMDFKSDWNAENEIHLSVGNFSNTDELMRRGLLMRFGDGDLIVRFGKKEDRYAYYDKNSNWRPVI